MRKPKTITAVLTALALVVIVLPAAGAPPAGAVEIRVLSNRADQLSGGDALVEVVLPGNVDPAGVEADLNGADVSDTFALRPNGRVMGLVTGLALGENVLTVRLAGGAGARHVLTNHPTGGPVFSGPQVQPWVCTTDDNGLGAPIDDQCNAPTVYAFRYRSVESGGFEDYDPDNPPADSDIATTTTDQGETVPYIVRIERGTLNRGLYQIAVLFNPDEPWAPQAPQRGWNRKLFYPFGASCNTNYSQGSFGSAVEVDQALSRGFAVASSGLNTLGQNCNTVTSAETVMMVKERLVEQYGEIRYTFGRGGSGGSIGQFVVGNAYPGLLQGLLPSATYPDSLTTGGEVFDCHLLVKYFNATSPHLWTDLADQTAVNGHAGVTSCVAWEALFSKIGDPTSGCGLLVTSAIPTSGVPTKDDYHPVLNRAGCRATVQDLQTGVFGRRAQDGFGKNLFDNVGVQYGLNALQDSVITPAPIEADERDVPRAVKVLDNRPEVAVDSCFVSGQQVTDQQACDAAYPYFGDARMAAGESIDRLASKCQLQPLDRASYDVEFSDAEWARLQRAFPAGVCDWDAPGVGEVPSQPWMSFAGGPGGRPLGDPPTSQRLAGAGA
jgi:hypothetical protein